MERTGFLKSGHKPSLVEGTMTNLEGRVFYRPRVFEPAGAAMPDAWLLCALAERLGRGRYFSYSSMSEVFDELCRASAGGKADYSGISYSRLQEAQGLFWPCPGTPRLFAGGVFPRAGGRVRLTSRRGSLEVAAKVTKDIHPRTMFVPFHWGGDLAVNRLTNDALHPISRMPELKISAVRAERVELEFADTHRDPGTESASWSNARDSGEVEYTPGQRTADRTAADSAALAASRRERS